MPTIEVSEETYEKIKDQLTDDDLNLNSWDDLFGQKWLFRTVTTYIVGRVKSRMGPMLIMGDASWVADTGRFSDALKKGTLSEVEPVGACLLNTATIVDGFAWKHPLPTEQK